jgi:uncharacterized protein YcbX
MWNRTLSGADVTRSRVSLLPMRRFRPSVVVDTAVPFDEDRWTRRRIGSIAFRAVKGRDQCVLTTIEQNTLESGEEPIRTLPGADGGTARSGSA